MLAELIRDYIHEKFDTENRIVSDDEIYTHFQTYEPSEHIIEKEINAFFDGHYILQNTVIEYEGPINPQVQIEMEEAK